ncbi:MAG TPA: LysR substrate-binding domain-containing protein [Pusillimonas sp.]|uniref:LysR family transcriptional regulator n=1 Tax=unclassified Pusillimonas TaxID=2640016 RepID=UPI00261C624F|nr:MULTISPECIES: LysR family transcriptional regulator [unclassified Pusillimonas]HLU18499.1 LysR substrate-binding domain-containing protein [Pusillimonas sp.]
MALTANDLILFAHVIEAGSFSRAADRIGLPKSTLSRRITQLENQLGERLLTRSTRKLTITDFGERILEHARRLVEETEAAKSLALHRQVVPQGTLRISMPPEYRELSVVTLIRRFHEAYPQVKLELDLSARRVDLIAERFDLAVRIAGRLPDDGTLIARQVAVLRNGLYASPNYLAQHGIPDKPADLLHHTGLVIIPSSGEVEPWRLSCDGERWEGLPDNVISSNALGLQQALAIEGMGIVGLSERFAHKNVEKGMLVPVLPGWTLPTVTAWCVMPGRRLLPERTRAFVELFKQILDEDGCAPA